MHDFCHVHELSLVMSNGLSLDGEAGNINSICYYLAEKQFPILDS